MTGEGEGVVAAVVAGCLYNLAVVVQKVPDVVQEPGRDGDNVQLHVGQKVRHFQRMHQIWLARMAQLALVLERRKGIRPA